MEHVYTRESNTSSHTPEDPTAPLIQAGPPLSIPNGGDFDAECPARPSPSSSTTKSQRADKPSLRSKPLFQGFERPSFSRIAILTVLCVLTYPTFYLLTLVARGKSLFVVRLIVGMWCSVVGFAIGYFLLKTGAQHLEATTWATVIHMSYEGDGIKLGDLAGGSSNPISFMHAFHVFRSRFGNRETSRHSRKSYDERPWSLSLGLFVILAILGTLLPFLFGRITRIENVPGQRRIYSEVLIPGDLSPEDVDRAVAQLGASQDFGQTWTLPTHGRSPPDTMGFIYANQTVYFAQPRGSQFAPGGSGDGTFNLGIYTLNDTPKNSPELTDVDALSQSRGGAVLRYPQWGIKTWCEKLPNPAINLIPISNRNFTYAFIPRDFLRDVDDLDVNDTIPSDIDPSTISYLGWQNDGATLSIHTTIFEDIGNRSWATVETVLIRLNTSFTPSGRFPVYSKLPGKQAMIGYDAAVCVQLYEPWLIQTYNATIGPPSILQIAGRGDALNPPSPSDGMRGIPIRGATRYLNATGKDVVFHIAHANGISHMVKDNRGGDYLPSPTVVSFTSGTGPLEYGELSPDRLAIIRVGVVGGNTLPYLAGSGPVVARLYADADSETLAFAYYKWYQLVSLLVLTLVLGVVGELFIPTLPLNIPRREFGVYSWLVLLQSQELRFEATDDLDNSMSLDELEKRFSDKRVKFVVEKADI